MFRAIHPRTAPQLRGKASNLDCRIQSPVSYRLDDPAMGGPWTVR